MTALGFCLVAAATGLLEARSLARSARGHGHPLAPLGRLLVVGAVLVPAARAGHVLAAAIGWLLGLGGAGAWIHRRWS